MSTTMASAPSPSGQAFSSRVHRGERIIQRIHEHPAHDIDHQHAAAAGRLVEIGARARRALGIIRGPQDAVFLLDIGEDFLLVGPVIAGGDHIDAAGEEFLGDGAGEAEAAGGILAIGDDQIELQRVAQARQFGRHHVAARLADDVAQEKNVHRKRLEALFGRMPSSAISCGSRGSEATSCPA